MEAFIEQNKAWIFNSYPGERFLKVIPEKVIEEILYPVSLYLAKIFQIVKTYRIQDSKYRFIKFLF